MRLNDVLLLMRPYQWYKNLLVFIAVIFSRHLSDAHDMIFSVLGFVSLCAISSAVYVCNDIIDRKKDRENPEKKTRPIAAGRVGIPFASVLMAVLLVFGLFLGYYLSFYFMLLGFALFGLSLLYSVFLKDILFADIITISANFVIRAISGAVIINVYVSSWLVVGVFFFAMYLVIGKRYAELNFLKDSAAKHRSTLGGYSKDMMNSLFSIFLSVLMVVFAIFSFSSENKNLIWTMPIFVYLLLRYYYIILSGSAIARHPQKILRDKPTIIASVIFIVLTVILMMW